MDTHTGEGARDGGWWWCLTHETVEQGSTCRAQDRLGPYPTADAARDWKARRDAREEAWEAEDERWES
ncbi:hypothetical protein [Euzebya sp.]|uniref:hypothetical protein n=1 Tax=Euzebya sp. TaxID=1971409 RepID=UPI0035160104